MFEVLNKHADEDTTRELTLAHTNVSMRNSLIENVAASERYFAFDGYSGETAREDPFKKCHYRNGTERSDLPEECDLVNLINDTISSLDENHCSEYESRYDKKSEMVLLRMSLDYVMDAVKRGEAVEIDKYREVIESGCNITIGVPAKVQYWQYDTFRTRDMVALYSLFFPLVVGYDGERVPLRTMDQFHLEPVESKGKRIGDILGQFAFSKEPVERKKNYLPTGIDHLEGVIAESFYKIIARITGIPELDNEASVTEFLTFFSYDVNLMPVTKLSGSFESECSSKYKSVDCFSEEDKKVPEACERYCSLARKGLEVQDKVQEILEMSVPKVGQGFGIKDSLPACKWDSETRSENCWNKIVTDRGVCYTNYDKGWL